ncbi:MAG: hypothetical protein AAB636_01240 [Patescibacteria group bacterium]
MKKRKKDFSEKITHWIGSTKSIIIHTIFFVGIFSLYFFNFSSSDILLILTTVVSLEAIYLAIFIQITINRHSEDLVEVSEDIEELQEDVGEIQEDVDEIQKDVDEIQEDVEEISEDEKEEKIEKEKEEKKFKHIEETLQSLLNEISELKNKK